MVVREVVQERPVVKDVPVEVIVEQHVPREVYDANRSQNKWLHFPISYIFYCLEKTFVSINYFFRRPYDVIVYEDVEKIVEVEVIVEEPEIEYIDRVVEVPETVRFTTISHIESYF